MITNNHINNNNNNDNHSNINNNVKGLVKERQCSSILKAPKND